MGISDQIEGRGAGKTHENTKKQLKRHIKPEKNLILKNSGWMPMLLKNENIITNTCQPCELCVRLGAGNRDKVVKVQETLPNHLIKQLQEVDS